MDYSNQIFKSDAHSNMCKDHSEVLLTLDTDMCYLHVVSCPVRGSLASSPNMA